MSVPNELERLVTDLVDRAARSTELELALEHCAVAMVGQTGEDIALCSNRYYWQGIRNAEVLLGKEFWPK